MRSVQQSLPAAGASSVAAIGLANAVYHMAAASLVGTNASVQAITGAASNNFELAIAVFGLAGKARATGREPARH